LEDLDKILQSIGDGIIVTRLDGKIEFINEIGANLVGYNMSEAKGKLIDDIFKIINRDTKKALESPHSRAIRHGRTVGLKKHTALVSRDGTERYVSASNALVRDNDNNVTGVVIVFRDITRIKKMEDEIERAKDAAEAANRVKNTFLANITHEMRTPLNGLLGMIDLTLLSSLDEDQKENLEIAKGCGKSFLKVINDILDFIEISENKIELEKIEFNLEELIDTTMNQHKLMAGEKNIKMTCEINSNTPIKLIGDSRKLNHVLNNLILNAIKFTDAGEIKVKIQKNEFENKASQQNIEEIKFTVSDTGIGISKVEIGSLFKGFSQIDDSYTRKYGGIGLGLAISQKIVEAMGGTIWIDSEKDKGSTFYFTAKFEV
jgi:PAS domain S-box-containing protein